LESAFWHEKWEKGELDFHRPDVHPLLTQFWSRVVTQHDGNVFVPLCGKTLDMGYLHSMGHTVTGVEIDERAVKAVFEDQRLEPEITEWRGGQLWQARGLHVYQGDFFQLQAADLGQVDAVYDRAALVALPPPMRALYATRLAALTGKAPQLLITFEYDTNQMDGPPFSVTAEEVEQRYGERFHIEELSREDIIEKSERFKEQGLDSIMEVAWLLTASG
jgi:thiopurine S-methyltransferase